MKNNTYVSFFIFLMVNVGTIISHDSNFEPITPLTFLIP